MRGVELVMGGLLVAFGVLAPLDPAGVGDADPGAVEGDLLFSVAEVLGDVHVEATDAGARVEGPLEAHASGRVAEVTFYDERFTSVAAGTHPGWIHRHSITHYRFEEADVQVAGDADGALMAWPTGDGLARFDLLAHADGESDLFASPQTGWLKPYNRDWDHAYLLEAPVFALRHGGAGMDTDDFHHIRFGDISFYHLAAEGGLTLVVENARIAIDHADGRDTFHARTGEDELAWDDIAGAPETKSNKVTYAVITLTDGRLGLGFENTRAALLAHDPTWTINGTLALQAEDGHLRAPDAQRGVDGENVRVVGNSTLRLQGIGEPDGTSYIQGFYISPKNQEDTRVEGRLESDDGHVTVNGKTFVEGAEVPVANEAARLATAVGILLFALSVGKKLAVFVLGLVRHDPLANQRRRDILAFVEKSGMAHVREIHRATGIPMGSLDHHLKVLRQAKRLVSVRRAGYHVYFVPSPVFGLEDLRSLALLADDTRRAISEVIAKEKGLTQSQIGATLGVSRSAVSRQLRELEAAGLVEGGGGRGRVVRPGELLRVWFARRTPETRRQDGHNDARPAR